MKSFQPSEALSVCFRSGGLPGEGLRALLAVGDAQSKQAPASLLIFCCRCLHVLYTTSVAIQRGLRSMQQHNGIGCLRKIVDDWHDFGQMMRAISSLENCPTASLTVLCYGFSDFLCASWTSSQVAVQPMPNITLPPPLSPCSLGTGSDALSLLQWTGTR